MLGKLQQEIREPVDENGGDAASIAKLGKYDKANYERLSAAIKEGGSFESKSYLGNVFYKEMKTKSDADQLKYKGMNREAAEEHRKEWV